MIEKTYIIFIRNRIFEFEFKILLRIVNKIISSKIGFAVCQMTLQANPFYR